MMSRLSVCVIPTWFPCPLNRNLGSFIYEQIVQLSDHVDLSVLNIATRWLTPALTLSLASDLLHVPSPTDQCRYYQDVVSALPRLQPLTDRLYLAKADRLFQRILARGKPDLLHAHVTYPAGRIGMFLAARYGLPLIVTEHASSFDTLRRRPLYAKHFRRVLSKADRYIAVSQALCNRLEAAGCRDCVVIPNGVDLQSFPLKPAAVGKPEASFVFINVGSMRPVKGIDLLLRAMHILVHVRGIKTSRLVLVGSGTRETEYRHLAAHLNVAAFCSFLGQVPHEAVVQQLHLADALVISSRIETFCIAAIEAMACGLPVVATDCGGPREYITQQNGYLVPPENPELLAAGMARLMANRAAWDASAIRAHVSATYSSEKVVRRILDTYEETLASQRRPSTAQASNPFR